MTQLILFVIALIVEIPALLLRGYVLTQLWGWFIRPLGIMPITIAHALGLSVIWSLLSLNLRQAEDPNLEKKRILRQDAFPPDWGNGKLPFLLGIRRHFLLLHVRLLKTHD